MENKYLNDLFTYLHELSCVQGAGHFVNEEIKECIKEIRTEMGFVEAKEKNVNDSKRMIFEAKIGSKPTLTQSMLFEAVTREHNEGILPYTRGTGATTGALILAELFPNVHFVTHRGSRKDNKKVHGYRDLLRGKFRQGEIVIVDYLGEDIEVNIEGPCQVIYLEGIEQ